MMYPLPFFIGNKKQDKHTAAKFFSMYSLKVLL